MTTFDFQEVRCRSYGNRARILGFACGIGIGFLLAWSSILPLLLTLLFSGF